MLNKLLKYDLKYMLKSISVFYILAFFFSITTRILDLFEKTFMINVLYKISMGCVIAMFFNIVINTMFRLWNRFKKSLYSDEAYLTHTLPVSKTNLLLSKLLLTLIYTIIGFVIIVICVFIAFYTKDRFLYIKDNLLYFSDMLNVNIIPIAILLFLVFFLEIINAINCGYLGMIFGYRHNNMKMGLSVLYGFVVYNITQVICLIGIVIYALFDKGIFKLFISNNMPSFEIFNRLLIIALALYIINILVVNLVSIRVFNKGVNLD